MSNKKYNVIDDDDCYFTCIICDQKARKVDRGRCIECYNKEYNKQKDADRFLANDPIDW